MNPFALCRWIGSTLPGGYSTVIIRPSLPGRFGKSFDIRSVTLASCASSVPDMRQASARISFVNFIKHPFDLMTYSMRRVFRRYVAVRRSAAQVPVPHAANLQCGVRLVATCLVQTESELGN